MISHPSFLHHTKESQLMSLPENYDRISLLVTAHAVTLGQDDKKYNNLIPSENVNATLAS